MARVKRSVMEANALRLLMYLDSRASAGSHVAIVPLRSMVSDLHMTSARVRRLVRLLDERGYIEVQHRFAEDGGGKPNAHRITNIGSMVIEAYRAGLRSEGDAEHSFYAPGLASDHSGEQLVH